MCRRRVVAASPRLANQRAQASMSSGEQSWGLDSSPFEESVKPRKSLVGLGFAAKPASHHPVQEGIDRSPC